MDCSMQQSRDSNVVFIGTLCIWLCNGDGNDARATRLKLTIVVLFGA